MPRSRAWTLCGQLLATLALTLKADVFNIQVIQQAFTSRSQGLQGFNPTHQVVIDAAQVARRASTPSQLASSSVLSVLCIHIFTTQNISAESKKKKKKKD
jgi:hypothetical protein